MHVLIKLYLRYLFFDEDVIVVIILMFYLIEWQFQNITSVTAFIIFSLAVYGQDFPPI